MNPLQQNIRFSQNVRPTPLTFGRNGEDFRKEVVASGEKAGDILLKKPTDPVPPTRMRRAWIKLGTGLAALAALAGSVAGVSASYGQFNEYRADKAAVAPLEQLHGKIFTSWDQALQVGETAAKTDGLADPALSAEFASSLEGALVKTLQTLKEQPGRLDAELVKQLDRNYDFMPKLTAQEIAPSFTQFMETELQERYGVSPAKARLDQIQAIDITEFLNGLDAFDGLSGSAKAALSGELNLIYQERHTFIQPTYFTGVLSGALSSGIEGATLSDFAQAIGSDKVATEAEAIAFVSSFIDNNQNFQKLTGGQRDALKERMAEVLDSLEFESPQPWGETLAMLLALAATGGSLFMGLKKKHLIRLATEVPADFYNGLNKPILHINQDAGDNPEAVRHLSLITSNIDYYAGEIERLMKEQAQLDPQVKQVLEETFQGNLPDARTIVRQFIYNTKQAIMEKRTLQEKLAETPMNELTFVQEVNRRIEEAYEMGDFLMLGLPKGMIKPAEKPDVSTATNPLEALRLERERIEYELKDARKELVNRIFGYAQASESLGRQDRKVSELENQMLALGDQPDTANREKQLISLNTDLQSAKDLQGIAREKAKNMQQLMLQAQMSLGKYIAQMRTYSVQLSQTIARGQLVQDVDALREIEKTAKQTLEDPSLQQLIDEVSLETHIREAMKEEAQMIERFNQLTQAQ